MAIEKKTTKKAPTRGKKAPTRGKKARNAKPQRAAKPTSGSAEEADYLTLLPLVEALPKQRAQIPRFDPLDGATAGLRLYEIAAAKRAKLRHLDAAQPGTLEALDRLPKLARGFRYVRQRLLAAQNLDNRQVVPVELVKTADARRARMTSVLDYNLPGDDEVQAALRFIRDGKGHQDRVNDLEFLGSLYEKHRGALSKDVARYTPDDLEGAREDARKIQAHLDEDKVLSATQWSDHQSRLHTLLNTDYELIRRALIFLDPTADIDATYPGLTAAARALGGRATRRAPEADAAPTSTVDGAPAPTPNGVKKPTDA